MTFCIAPWCINYVIDGVFRGGGAAPSWGLGPNLYLALLTEAPYAYYDGLLFDAYEEASYTGYARRTIPRSLTGFLSTQGTTSVSTGTSGATQPAIDQYFPLCTTSSVVVTHAALVLHEAQYETDNEALCYWSLARPFPLRDTTPGIYPCLHAQGLTISLDS